MASIASLTASSAAASSSAPSCTSADFSRFPTADVACAVGSTQGIPANTSDVLNKCCKTAPVDTFNGAGCGYYCLSVQQSVAELQKCFQDGGVRPADIFCNGNNTASASGTPRSMASATSASGAGGAASTGAAGRVAGEVGVSKAGLGMLGMIVVSVFAGAML